MVLYPLAKVTATHHRGRILRSKAPGSLCIGRLITFVSIHACGLWTFILNYAIKKAKHDFCFVQKTKWFLQPQ